MKHGLTRQRSIFIDNKDGTTSYQACPCEKMYATTGAHDGSVRASASHVLQVSAHFVFVATECATCGAFVGATRAWFTRFPSDTLDALQPSAGRISEFTL